MRRAGIGGPIGALLIVAAAAAGCSSGSGLAARPPAHSTGSTAQPSSPVSTPPPAGLPTGPELARLLPPHTGFPAGWTRPSYAQWTRNLTAQFSKPLAELGPAAVRQFNTCVEVNLAASGANLMALWQMSWAYAEARPPHFPSGSIPATVTIADFLPGGAVRQLAWDRALATRCHHFRDPTDHSPVTVTATPVHGLGDQALYVQVVNPYHFGGLLIHGRSGTLLVRAGSDMIAASQGGTTSDPNDKAIPFSRLRQLARQYLGSVSQLSSP
jgi:hypothetical protein